MFFSNWQIISDNSGVDTLVAFTIFFKAVFLFNNEHLTLICIYLLHERKTNWIRFSWPIKFPTFMSHGLKIVNATSSQDMTQRQKCKQESLWREEKCSKNQKRSQGGSNKRIEEKTTVAQFSKPGNLSATTDTANVTEQDKGKHRLYILTQGLRVRLNRCARRKGKSVSSTTGILWVQN